MARFASTPGIRNTIYRRFRRQAENGVLSQVMEAIQNKSLSDAGFSVLSSGSTFVKSSPSAVGALKKNGPQAIGRTKDVKQLATMVRAIVAGPTISVVLKLLLGNVSDAPVGREILRNLDVRRLNSKFVLIDRAYEGDETRQTARDVGLKPVVPPKRNRRRLWRNNQRYKRRNEIERLFRRIQDFRRIVTRYGKLDVMFSAFVNFVAIVILLNL